MLRTLRPILGGLAIAFALSLHAAELARAEAADDSTAVADDLPSKPTKDDVSKLIKKLRDKDALIRMKAAKLLGGLGADAKDALPELSKLLSDPDIDVRSVASNAMNKIQTALDNKQSLDDLQQKLNNALADKKTAQRSSPRRRCNSPRPRRRSKTRRTNSGSGTSTSPTRMRRLRS